MGVIDWAMLAAGLALFLNAVRLLFGGEGGEGDNKKRTLGCTFGLIASLVWAYSFQRLLGSWWSGLRLSVGIALLLPAIAAFANPNRGRLIRAFIALIVSLMLAGPMVQPLLDRMDTTEAGDTLSRLQSSLDEMNASMGKLGLLRETLSKDRGTLQGEIRGLATSDGRKSFDNLEAAPGGMAKLEELAEVVSMISEADKNLERLRSRIPVVQSAIRRLERQALASESMGEELEESEIGTLLERYQRDPVYASVRPTQQHLEHQQLKYLFEMEVGW